MQIESKQTYSKVLGLGDGEVIDVVAHKSMLEIRNGNPRLCKTQHYDAR
jgi:hypothetical protein